METSIVAPIVGEWVPVALRVPKFDNYQPKIIRTVLCDRQIVPAFWVGNPTTGAAWWVDNMSRAIYPHPSHWYEGPVKSLDELPLIPLPVGNCRVCHKSVLYLHEGRCMQCYIEWRDKAVQSLRSAYHVP